MNSKRRVNLFVVLFLILFYISAILIFKKEVFTYQFNIGLIARYFRSQDIPHEVVGRLFLSDGEIHTAAGYLYAVGYDPTTFNFQHPPFIKYLYGASILFFNTPYVIQILLGVSYILLTYCLGIKIFRGRTLSTLACILLILDPLFLDISSQPLLDLGQAVFSLLYVISFLFYPQNFILQGIFLGLSASSKFWAPTLFFILVLFGFRYLIKKERNWKSLLISFLVAFLVFTATYTRTFINQKGKFNIIFYQLKILKYWFNHSIASIPGASLFLFLTGYFKSWWGKKNIIRSNVWTIIWPVSFVASIFGIIKNKKINNKIIVFLIPVLYLLYLGVQAPFPRYFIMILPYSYLGLAYMLWIGLKNYKHLISRKK